MSSYLKILFCAAAICLSQQSLAEGDPCLEFPGNWNGSWHVSTCRWDTELVATMYKDVVRLTGKVMNGGNYCYDSEVSLTGTCKDGKVELEGYSGHMFSGLLTLENRSGDFIIAKKS